MTNIKVSVLTSLYKHKPEYVRQCLDSLVEQTLKDCEFILIDNGSDENNKALIKEYLEKDPRFRAVYLDTNIGMGAALNCGMEASKGEYIGFLESDDFTEPEMFADLYAKSDNGQLDIVKSLFNTLDEKGNIKLEKNFPDSQLDSLLKKGQCSGLIQGHVSHWSGIYRKEFLKENKIDFNETPGGHSQDFGFILQCYACAKSVYVISHAYVTYRLFSGVHEFKFLNDCMLDECELTFKKLRKKKLPQEVWEVLFFRIAPRLKACLQTADKKQKKRIIREITRNSKFQAYKYFPPSVKQEIKQLIKINTPFYKLKYGFLHTYIETPQKTEKKFCGITYFKKKIKQNKVVYSYVANLFKVIEKNTSTRYQFLGIPFVVKKDTAQKKYIKILGIPIYYKEDKQFEIKQQLNVLHQKFIETNKYLLEQKNVNNILNQKLSNMKCIIEAQSLHPKTFGKYKNAFAGRDVVLVCTGPTAKNYKPIKDAIHVGVNGAIYLNQVKLDYLFMQDYTIKQKNNSTLNIDGLNYQGNHCKKFFGIIPDDRLAVVKKDILRIPLMYSYSEQIFQYIIEDIFYHNIASDLSREPIGDFAGTPFSALQFILYAHPKRLYLVGWDCNAGYAYNKPNAMNPANYQIDILKNTFLPFINLNYPDIEIISINPVGLKGVFKDMTM